MGRAEALQPGCFRFFRWDTADLAVAAVAALSCQTKVNACLASEVLGWRGSSTSGCQGLQRARGRTVPDVLGGMGWWQRPAALQIPRSWAQGITAKGKSPKVCWSLRAKAPRGGWPRRAAVSGSARPVLGPGRVAQGRDRTARASPAPFSRLNEGNTDLSCGIALPHEYATGSPYFVKAAKVKKNIIQIRAVFTGL